MLPAGFEAHMKYTLNELIRWCERYQYSKVYAGRRLDVMSASNRFGAILYEGLLLTKTLLSSSLPIQVVLDFTLDACCS